MVRRVSRWGSTRVASSQANKAKQSTVGMRVLCKLKLPLWYSLLPCGNYFHDGRRGEVNLDGHVLAMQHGSHNLAELGAVKEYVLQREEVAGWWEQRWDMRLCFELSL